MSPLDRLRPERIGEANIGGQFWPDTFFVELAGTEFGKDGSDWAASAHGAMAASGLLHEQVHWMQLHGTTAGVFSTLLRHKRQELIECYLRSLSAEERRTCFEAWRDRGAAIWQLNNDWFPQSDLACTPSQRRLLSHWGAMFVFDEIFRHGGSANARLISTYDFEELLRICYYHTDGSYQLGYLFGHTYTQFDLPPHRAVAPNPSFDDVVRTISTRAIEECAAYLNQRDFYSLVEHGFWIGGPTHRENVEKLAHLHDGRWQMHLDDPSHLYTACIKYFAEYNDHLDLNDEPPLLALMIILDIALNPPLPPFVNLENRFSEGGATRITASDVALLMPTTRFIRLVGAVKKVGVPQFSDVAATTDQEAKAYIGKLCHAAGLMAPLECDARSIDAIFTDTEIANTLEDSPLAPSKALILDHAARSMALRKRFPLAFACPVRLMIGTSNFPQLMTDTGWTTCMVAPMQIIDATGYFVEIDERQYRDVLGSVAFGLALTSLVGSNGIFFVDGLPRDASHSRTVTNAHRYLSSRLLGQSG